MSQSLTAFSRTVHCHRRLARLAPSFFDSLEVDREARERAEQRCWRTIWEPALTKIYGCEFDNLPPNPDVDLHRLPGVRTQRVIERELAGWAFWMDAGRAAMARHHQRRPHALLSLNQIARLFRVAIKLKSVSFGASALDSPPESPD